jgi:hypothetical protein
VRSRAVVFVDGLPSEADPEASGDEVLAPRTPAAASSDRAGESGVPTAGLVA